MSQKAEWVKRMNRASALVLAVCWIGSGCGRKPTADAVSDDIRGEPIIATPAKASTTSTSALTTTVVSAVPLPPATNTAPTPDGAVADSKVQTVGFDKLSSFNFEISDELLGPITNDLAAAAAKTDGMIPPQVKAFDKKRVELKGFMLPLKVEGGLVTELLIMKDQSMCCYGVVPKINEWVSVKMVSKGVRPVMDEAVTLQGTLHVGEMRENGYLVGIYRLDGERMAAALEQ